jgi:hypothetical protein
LQASEALRGFWEFLGKFQGTFGKNVVEVQIKSTRRAGLFEYLNNVSDMMNFCAID